jgi:S-adenosylmethionine:tRNA ribosyltransferase-isomerase
LPDNALVVVNESKVVPARLHAVRDDGRSFELLVCAPRAGQRQVRAWVRGARRLKEGDRLQVGGLIMRASGTDAIDRRARLFEVVDGDVLEACEHHGIVPLPPYIERPPLPEDRQRYQTVYAGPPGSVAAPTAGLHLEPEMIAALEVVRIVLHVGPGTFLPMEVSDVADHRVGEEHVEIDVEAAARIRAAQNAGRPIVAVGTTVTRALESVARERGEIVAMRGSTRLVITPGFDFRVVTHLLTNFHLPRSSLLMLVCAFGGMARVMAAYRQAITAGYRFYSYGDCMLCPADPNHRRS